MPLSINTSIKASGVYGGTPQTEAISKSSINSVSVRLNCLAIVEIFTRLRCIIHGNITSSPVTRWAALRGPRRPVLRTGVFAVILFLAVFLAVFFTVTFLAVFFAVFFTVTFLAVFFARITYLPLILRATASLACAPRLALKLLRYQPLQTTTTEKPTCSHTESQTRCFHRRAL